MKNDTKSTVIEYTIIGILVAFIVFNLTVMIWDGVIDHWRKHSARRQNIVEFRKNRHSLFDLN